MSLIKEETEVKTKQDLIEKWESYKNGARTVADMRAIEYADKFINDLEQLDEPEVLSQEWIDEHITDGHNVNLGDKVVYADELDGVLVPKQEITGEQFVNYAMDNDLVVFEKEALEDRDEMIIENYTKNKVVIEKPVIPKFVAEYLDFAKSDTTLMRVLELANTRNEWEKWEKEYDWIEESHELFARAWLDGYEVEEGKKYYVVSRGNRMMLVRMMGGETVTEAVPYEFENVDECVRKSYQLTEQEIKDYDERFWPFAVKVEELEE